VAAQQTGKGRKNDMAEKKLQRFELKDCIRSGYVPSPAEVIQDELATRGWSLAGFAARIEWDQAGAKVFLQSWLPIKDETAEKLGQVFGTSPDFWQNLDCQYQTWKNERT
jgi:plasmid maintenance system antidote protein VapI